ncbi:FecR domain-containing protein [Rhodopirellula sallentina]|uniref:FecR protein n=1 Tax=Rhodopirellula sallentina SM41 TaxID=1263870 RepID=M5UAP0_9BACT|nr:FecR domain-containing protein [Rhodopirellula sallentina]EMI53068.1 FecR protein [Rhodopirellula sallentina SM41]
MNQNNNPHATRRRLEELGAAFIDRTITQEEIEELDFLLRDDSRNRILFLQYMDLQSEMVNVLSRDSDEKNANAESVFDWASTLAEYASTRRTSSQTRTNETERASAVVASHRSNLAPWLVSVASVAVSLMFAFAFYTMQSVENTKSEPTVVQQVVAKRTDQNLVRLADLAGAELFNEITPPRGQSLQYQHEYALVNGMMSLVFPCGAEVILEAPSVIEIADPMQLLVKAGKCSVHAPDGAEGFQVITPQTEVTDLGTRFSVSVDEGGNTEVQVIEGAAEVRQFDKDDSEKVLLKEKQASRFDGGESSSVDFTPTHYRRQLPDRIVGFHVASESQDLQGKLESVSIQHAGVQRLYHVDELIGVEVIHFRGGNNTSNLSTHVGVSAGKGDDRREALESDAYLHTGLINPGGSREPLTQDPVMSHADGKELTPGMAIRFREPVVNRPGPDVVFFELQSAMNPVAGDGFHVSPLKFEPNLRSHTVMRYDITLNSPEAWPVPDFELMQFDSQIDSLDDLLNGTFQIRNPAMSFWAIAVSIDFSDLGYDDDSIVEGLFFQDVMDDEHCIDPVFIAGLPYGQEEVE